MYDGVHILCKDQMSGLEDKSSWTGTDSGDTPHQGIFDEWPAALDGNYTAFAHVVGGMNVVEAIEQAPRTGETPNTRIELRSIRIEKR